MGFKRCESLDDVSMKLSAYERILDEGSRVKRYTPYNDAYMAIQELMDMVKVLSLEIRTLKEGAMMTQQEEYESLLSTMDWWYDRSDDYSVYSKGKRQWERICGLMKVIDKDQLIYKSYVKGL